MAHHTRRMRNICASLEKVLPTLRRWQKIYKNQLEKSKASECRTTVKRFTHSCLTLSAFISHIHSCIHSHTHSPIRSFIQLARFYLVAKIFRQRHVCVYVSRYMSGHCLSLYIVSAGVCEWVCVCVVYISLDVYNCLWVVVQLVAAFHTSAAGRENVNTLLCV